MMNYRTFDNLSLTFFFLIVLHILTASYLLNKAEALDEGAFQKLRTEHFLIYADTRISELQNVAKSLEECFAIVAATFPKLAPHVPVPIEVCYFAQHDDFDSVTLYQVDRSQYRMDMDLPYGFFQMYPDKVRINITRSVFKKYIPELFQHMTRMFVFYAIKNPPLWLEDGLQYFAGSLYQGEDYYHIGKIKADPVNNLRTNGIIPLSQFLKLSKTSSLLKGDEDYYELFKNQALVFISFLFYADNNAYQEFLYTYLYYLMNGWDRNQAFLEVFECGTIPLQSSLKQYIMRTSMPYAIINRDAIKYAPIGKPEPATRAEIDASLGDEFIRHDNLLKAEQYYTRGMANDGSSLANIFGMMKILYYQQQESDFQKKLESVLELSKDNYQIQRELAFFLSRIDQKSTALSVLLRLNNQLDNDISLLKLASETSIELKDNTATRKFLTLLLAYLPEHKRWSDVFISLLVEDGDREKALSYILQLLARNPNNKTLLSRLIELVSSIDDQNHKASVLLQAHKIQPDSLDLNRGLGDLYLQLNNKHAALAYLKKALSLSPDNQELSKLVDELNKDLEKQQKQSETVSK